MIQYRVKSSGSVETYMEILREQKEGFEVLITCICENYRKTVRDYLDRELFDACIRTGFLKNMEKPALVRESA